MSFRYPVAAVLLLAAFAVLARGTYQEPEAFLRATFADGVPDPQVVWLTGELGDQVKDLLGHSYLSRRVRYWMKGTRSAWILDEIGKDLPITTGIVIDDGRIERLKVLVFRESRGFEVRHEFFTDQFTDARLKGDRKLDRRIDNISGATLSVNALKKQALLALLLHQHVARQDVTP